MEIFEENVGGGCGGGGGFKRGLFFLHPILFYS